MTVQRLPDHRLALVAAVVVVAVVAVVGVGAVWSTTSNDSLIGGPIGGIHSAAISPVVAGPVNGPIGVRSTPLTGPGLSSGRATLTLSQPQSAPASFAIGCVWSVRGNVVELMIGKQALGDDYPYIRWRLAPGPEYRIEIVEPDQTKFSGGDSNYTSQTAADGHTGSIAFTDLTLNSGDPSTAPRRSGTFTWACDQTANLGSPAPSLPAPAMDEQGVPALWIIDTGKPVRRALTGCPIDLTTASGHFAASCATSNWWEGLQSLDSTLDVAQGDSLAFALDGWTVTSADVEAVSASSGSPPGVDDPMVVLDPVIASGAVAFSPPPPGSWYVQFTIEAARDDGSWLAAEYAYTITVH
jgi:hypothetical protein